MKESMQQTPLMVQFFKIEEANPDTIHRIEEKIHNIEEKLHLTSPHNSEDVDESVEEKTSEESAQEIDHPS